MGGIVRVRGSVIPLFRTVPSYFMFNGLLFALATGYEKLISRFGALAFLRGWILVTLKKR